MRDFNEGRQMTAEAEEEKRRGAGGENSKRRANENEEEKEEVRIGVFRVSLWREYWRCCGL